MYTSIHAEFVRETVFRNCLLV